MIRPLAALSLALAACTPPVREDMPERTAAPQGAVPEDTRERPAAPRGAAPEDARERPAAPRGAAAGPVPEDMREQPGAPAGPLVFTTVVEGHCPALGVSRVGAATLVHYGRSRYIGELQADGGVVDVTPPREAYAEDDLWLMSGEAVAIEGEWPERPLLRFFQSEGREWAGPRYLARGRDGKWAKLQDRGHNYIGVDRVDRWSDGNLLAHIDCQVMDGDPDCLGKVEFAVVRGPGKAPRFPTLARRDDRRDDCEHQMFDIEVRETGEIAMSGLFCHRPEGEGHDWFVVRHAPDRPLAVDRVPLAGSEPPYSGMLALRGPDELYTAASFGDDRARKTRVFALEDGAWRTLAPLAGELHALEVDGDGVLWALVSDTLHRREPRGAWQPASFVDGPVTAIGGFREGTPWVAQKDGGLWLRRGAQFEAVSLPPPALAPDARQTVIDVASFGAGELWISTQYAIKRPGWRDRESRRALLHSGPARPLLRCAQSARHTSERGLYPSPPAATAACPTIYAALVRQHSWAGKHAAYPQLGKLLRGQRRFAGLTFTEIELGGHKIAGAAVPDLALGEALTRLVAEGLEDTRPELLCAAPAVVRPLPFDLATGKLAAAAAGGEAAAAPAGR